MVCSVSFPSAVRLRYDRLTHLWRWVTDLSHSPLLRETAIAAGVFGVFVFQSHFFVGRYHVVASIVLIGAIVRMAYHWKPLLFEILLVTNVVKHYFFNWKWWSEVEEGIYLGAVPLTSLDHEKMLKNLDIKACLSIMESFELEAITLCGRVVAKQAWSCHRHIDSSDFFPPNFENLTIGADWINDQIQQGKKIYIHCKSGAGRSPSLLVAYYIKYQNMCPEVARQKVALARPYIFSPRSRMMRQLERWHKDNYLR